MKKLKIFIFVLVFVLFSNCTAYAADVKGTTKENINIKTSVSASIQDMRKGEEITSWSKKSPYQAGQVFVEPKEINVTLEASPYGAHEATLQDVARAKSSPVDLLVNLNEVKLRTSAAYLSGNFNVFSQYANYTCGPACVQAALDYLTGNAPSQQSIAIGCQATSSTGTYLVNMVAYINSQQTHHQYTELYNADFDSMKNALYNDISAYDVPSIIGLSFSKSDGWLYNTGGHFMTVYGYELGPDKFALGDPWIGYPGSGLGNNSWSYTQPAYRLYRAYNKNNLGLTY